VDEGRRGSFDTSFIAIGGVLSGALALGTALLFRFWLSTDGGPTAATLSEAFSLLYGAAIGLTVGAAFVAFGARTGPRVLSGSIAGLLGYTFVLAPVLIVIGRGVRSVASDHSRVSRSRLALKTWNQACALTLTESHSLHHDRETQTQPGRAPRPDRVQPS
jgi:hypothetical protein